MWLLRKIAWPISLVYGGIVQIRNLFFDLGIFTSKSFKTPTVCVGNLSVGGTGKTPMIEFLIRHLHSDLKLTVLSRGYKRKSKGFQLADSKSTVNQLGDEPYQLHKKFPNVQVAVDADRRNGISSLETLCKPDLILLDDAFQHRKVNPTFSILLTTYINPFYKDKYLPTGNLRDSKSSAKRANVIIVTKCPTDITAGEMKNLKGALTSHSKQRILFSTLEYASALIGSRGSLSLTALKNQKFTLVTGIANPSPLVAYLTSLGLQFEHLKFPDHHSFTKKEISHLKKRGLIVTTEKDYVRLNGRIETLFYLGVEHKFVGNGKDKLLSAVKNLC